MGKKEEIPLEWLVCPITKEKLLYKDGFLFSSQYKWEQVQGVWNFVPTQLSELTNEKWQAWGQLQANSQIPYTRFPEQNLGVGKRQDFLEFIAYCNFQGTILDIGVGPQKNPTHIEFTTSENAHFIGIDPLLGEQPRDFTFLLGLGEYLPFREGLFDQVLYVTTLDHFIDPAVTLKEAKRVLKDKGRIFIWLGEKDKNTPRPAENPDWYKKLIIPAGAEDPFHFKRFTSKEFERYLEPLKLKITDRKILEVDQWRKNLFYTLRK